MKIYLKLQKENLHMILNRLNHKSENTDFVDWQFGLSVRLPERWRFQSCECIDGADG